MINPLVSLHRNLSLLLFCISTAFNTDLNTNPLPCSSFITQEQTKVFEKMKVLPLLPEPVPFLEIRTLQKVVTIGERFNAGEDWLRGTTFKLKNNSGKEIVRLSLELDFPETASTGNMMQFTIPLGRWPGIPEDTAEPVSIKAGEEITITVDEITYTRLTKFIETRQPISTINDVVVGLGLVVFADATAWSMGEYMRRDPKDPRRYTSISSKPPNN